MPCIMDAHECLQNVRIWVNIISESTQMTKKHMQHSLDVYHQILNLLILKGYRNELKKLYITLFLHYSLAAKCQYMYFA